MNSFTFAFKLPGQHATTGRGKDEDQSKDSFWRDLFTVWDWLYTDPLPSSSKSASAWLGTRG